MGKEKAIPIFAMVVLVIGITSTLYVNAIEKNNNISDNKLLINGFEYSFEDLSNNIETVSIVTDDGERIGIPLEKIITFSDVNCPACNEYKFIASDPYQQIISWNDVKTGILTYNEEYNLRVYFPNLPHSFWVHNLIEIEVNLL